MDSNKIKHLFEEKWLEKLKPFIESKQFDDIIYYLREEKILGKTIVPYDTDCFNAFKYCPFDKTKVVILGMDPYINMIYNQPEAQGLSFSYKPKGDNDFHIPKSLINVLSEVEEDCYNTKPEKTLFKPDLTRWAEQGVLLLNVALTTEFKKTGAHLKLWQPFTDYVFKVLNEYNSGLVFMLWGNDAKKYKDKIGNTHYILEAGHPSPLNTSTPFRGTKHFSKANEIIEKNNGRSSRINW